MKKTGYTLIELLAVIVILGVVGGAAIFSYTQYSKHARDKAYENLEETLFEGAQNYYMDHIDKLVSGASIDSNTLINGNYIDKLADPGDNNGSCNGSVRLEENAGSFDIADYKYYVSLQCKRFKINDVVFPK